MGGVVFLDEIGTANATIQAKLLAYLDDYTVRPRGWTSDPFDCPTLVVAATNRTLDELKTPEIFRADLLARFTDIEEVPSVARENRGSAIHSGLSAPESSNQSRRQNYGNRCRRLLCS